MVRVLVKMRHSLVYLVPLTVLLGSVLPQTTPPAPASSTEAPDPAEENPEGYYAFMESPNATPPRVRSPPYRQVPVDCAEAESPRPHVSASNLCGDLNRGTIPRNPMGQNPNGEPYPFELLRNHTLRFLSRTLPVLKADDTVPRVAHIAQPIQHNSDTRTSDALVDGGACLYWNGTGFQTRLLEHGNHNKLEERNKRSLDSETDDVPSHALPAEHRSADTTLPREGRKFCDEGGVFCMLYRAFNGNSEPAASVERREDPGLPAPVPQHRYEGPPTPCPARVEYATPVFARNYQGVWRYVVQIPYEGYFTQTVEVTRCMQSRCHYLEGGCLSSPRWVSLLVAELHYPNTEHNIQEYQQYLQNRGGSADPGVEPSTDKPPHCDGHDDLGCFQVRLYYDWFLVPGSCKCWRPDYFARYVRRRQNNEL